MSLRMALWHVLGFVGAVTSLAFGGQKVNVGRPVPEDHRISMNEIDHRVWNELLVRYVNEAGQVDYRGWQSAPESVQALDTYLNELSRGSHSLDASRESQLAFWINAYNAVTVKGILREYPTTSIRNHTARFAGYNIWKDLLLNVGGVPISLDSIEHKVLRKMSEPRIHFAIVCASVSCPRLLNQAYTAENLEAQLVANSKAFFASEQNFRHTARGFQLSAILDWFGSDFGKNQAAQLKAIAPYLPTEKAQAAAKANSVRVSHLEYDWELNEQVAAETPVPAR